MENNVEKNLNNEELDFEEINMKDQLAWLGKVQSKFIDEHYNEIFGSKSIDFNSIVVSYNKIENKSNPDKVDYDVVYDISFMENGVQTHQPCKLLPSGQLYEIPLADDNVMKMYEQFKPNDPNYAYQKQLMNLPNNPEKISSDELAKQIKELDESALVLGISPDKIGAYAKVDANNKIKLDNKKIGEKATKDATDMDANEKITTYYSLNDILGTNYKSIKIIKTSDTAYLMGVMDDDTIEKIDPSKYYMEPNSEFSLARDDGTIKKVNSIASFRIRDVESSNNQNQTIGLYNDGGNVGFYYARNAEGSKDTIGIPGETYGGGMTNQNKEMMDMTRHQNIDKMAESAEARTEDGNDNVSNIHDDSDSSAKEDIPEEISKEVDSKKEELADYASLYGTDVHVPSDNELEEKASKNFEENIENDDSVNQTDSQVVEKSVDEAVQDEKKQIDKEGNEKKKAENSDKEKNELDSHELQLLNHQNPPIY